MRVIVCIPAYNEAKNIANIIEKARPYCTQIVVCDDGSSDNTKEAASIAGAQVIRHPVNKGYGAAIKTLFNAAKDQNADIMVTLDSDGQHNPDQIPSVLEPILSDGYDIVIGSRFLTEADRDKVPLYRSIGIKTITKFTQLASYKDLTDAQSGFRAYSKNALSKIELNEEGMSVSTEILVRAKEKNLAIKEVPITITYDVEDASTHNPVSHGLGVLSTIVRFISLRHPLAFYGLPGVALLVIASGFMANALNLFSTTRYVSTNMILISVGAAVVGSMLLVTAIILYSLTALLRGKVHDL